MRVSRRPVVDEIVDGLGSAVMLEDNQVLVLSAAATSILEFVGSGELSDVALRDRLEERFGAPSGVDTLHLVRELVGELRSTGLVDVHELD